MAMHHTVNGVVLEFDNNEIKLREGDPPMIAISEDALDSVRINGYRIMPIEDYAKLRSLVESVASYRKRGHTTVMCHLDDGSVAAAELVIGHR